MGVKSSQWGKITLGASDIYHVTNWRLPMSGNNRGFASSSTAGHQETVKGMKSATLSFDVIEDLEDSIFDNMKVGDLVTLECYEDQTHKFTVPCRIESMEPNVNIAEGDPPSVAVEAMSHGAWTYPDGSASAQGS